VLLFEFLFLYPIWRVYFGFIFVFVFILLYISKSVSTLISVQQCSLCCGNLKLSYRTLRQISRKQCLLCQHRPSGLVFRGWALRTKGSHLIYPCKQVTEAKSKVQPTCGCMRLRWLFHFPRAMWPSCFNSSKFYLSALPSLPPSHCQNTACFFSGPPPCYISPFDAWTWLGSKNIILI
jgi:hypothetical protein